MLIILSRCTNELCQEKTCLGFPTRSDINWAVWPQKMARGLNFRIQEEERLYYLCSINKVADQLPIYRAGNLCHVYAYAKGRFSQKQIFSRHGSFHVSYFCML